MLGKGFNWRAWTWPLLLCAAVGLGFPVIAQDLPEDGAVEASDPGLPITNLQDALDRAYANNPSLLAERSRLSANEFRIPQARARSGPQVSFEASYGFRREELEQITGGTSAHNAWVTAASAVLTQPLFTFGRNAAGERTAQAQMEYQREALRAVEQQVLLQTVGAYVAVRREREAVRIAQDNLDLLENELIDNGVRLRARDTTMTDTQQVATRVEIGRAQLLQARNGLASAEASFLKTVGAPAGDLAEPTGLPLPARSLEDAYDVALKTHPVMLAAAARERISRSYIEQARADRMPRLDLRARAGLDNQVYTAEPLQQTDVRGELVLSGPIFQSGAMTSRVDEARAANDADWRLYDQALRETRSDITDAWNEWLTSDASLVNLAQAVTLAEQAHAGAVMQERSGLRTTLDVLDLTRDLLSARISYNQALASAHLARARVMAAMGVFDRDNIAMGQARYVPIGPQATGDELPLLAYALRAVDRLPLESDADRESRDDTADVLSAQVPLPAPQDSAQSAPLLDFELYLDQAAARRATRFAGAEP